MVTREQNGSGLLYKMAIKGLCGGDIEQRPTLNEDGSHLSTGGKDFPRNVPVSTKAQRQRQTKQALEDQKGQSHQAEREQEEGT